MKLEGREGEFVIIGENIHTTRVLLRKGKLVTSNPDGVEAVRYYDTDKKRRYLVIPEATKRTQDYEEGRVKHVKIAVQAAMSGQEPDTGDYLNRMVQRQVDAAVQAAMSGREPDTANGLAYLHRMVQRQVEAGADFLDLNVDEISLRLEDQKAAMQWLVREVEQISPVPLSVDSSNIETIRVGLAACNGRVGRPLLNSASLERLEALDLAREYNSRVIATAAGASGMPQNTEERIENASRMVDSALAKGLAIQDIFVDPLVFPISVDGEFGNHCLEAIRRLREAYGPEIHITGGFSNVSFGIPCRRLVNDVFTILAIEAGADSGIVDPASSSPQHIFSMDRASTPYRLAETMLLGGDLHCKTFLRAYRKGELEVS